MTIKGIQNTPINTQLKDRVTAKNGILRDHKVIILAFLGAASALASVAALIAAVFAAYILVIACAAVATALLFSSIIILRIKVLPQENLITSKSK